MKFILLLSLAGSFAFAQTPPNPPPANGHGGPGIRVVRPGPMNGPMNGPRPMGMGQRGPGSNIGGPPRWWTNPKLMQRLGITEDQKVKILEVYQSSRLKLIDVTAGLEKEEITLEPLVSAEQPDQTRILAQIDKVAHARAEVEKSNARTLLGIRTVLTKEQWTKLKAGPGRPETPKAPAQPE